MTAISRPAGHSRGFHGYRGSPRSAPHRTAGLPAAAVGRRHGGRRSTNTSRTLCSGRWCLRIFACPPARRAAGRPGVAVLNPVEPLAVQIGSPTRLRRALMDERVLRWSDRRPTTCCGMSASFFLEVWKTTPAWLLSRLAERPCGLHGRRRQGRRGKGIVQPGPQVAIRERSCAAAPRDWRATSQTRPAVAGI